MARIRNKNKQTKGSDPGLERQTYVDPSFGFCVKIGASVCRSEGRKKKTVMRGWGRWKDLG